MSPRYYLVTALLVVVLTAVISVARQTRSRLQIFLVFCYVVGGIALVMAALVGATELLAVLGIAKSGYIF